jgi:hypothetical protein
MNGNLTFPVRTLIVPVRTLTIPDMTLIVPVRTLFVPVMTLTLPVMTLMKEVMTLKAPNTLKIIKNEVFHLYQYIIVSSWNSQNLFFSIKYKNMVFVLFESEDYLKQKWRKEYSLRHLSF